MLSRIAESLFWIGRYLERADDTARILDVQMQVLVEDPGMDERTSCEQLLSVMGVEEYTGSPNRWMILDLLAHNPESPTSIAAAIGASRESARRARETLSTDIWAAINTTWRGLGTARSMRPPEMFAWVRNRMAMISGIAAETMSRDEGWQFYMLGRSIERADMTARLLSTAALASGPQVAWPTTLRACGAYEAFIRAYRGIEADRQAAEFLLLDRWFPRSIVSSLVEAEKALGKLANVGPRSGFSDEAQRLLGRARTELEYRPLEELVFDLPVEMERLQRSCAAASEAVSSRYFADQDLYEWTGGVVLVSMQLRDQARHRLPLRDGRRGVVQRGPDDAAHHARPDGAALAARDHADAVGVGVPRLLGLDGHGVRGQRAAHRAHRRRHLDRRDQPGRDRAGAPAVGVARRRAGRVVRVSSRSRTGSRRHPR